MTMDAEDLLLRQFLGILKPQETAEAAARGSAPSSARTARGPTSSGGPGDLSTTIEAYAALRLAGDDADEPHMAAARAFILAAGGIEASRVFTRIWLALFGEWSWDDLPSMPPELVLLPKWFPLNVYDWGCWARQTVVADHRGRHAATGAPAAFHGRRVALGRAAPAPSKTGPVADCFQRARQGPQALRPVTHQAGPGDGVAARHRVDPGVAKRPTAGGAASSHRGSIRSWPCI